MPVTRSKPPMSQRPMVLSMMPATGILDSVGAETLAGMLEPM